MLADFYIFRRSNDMKNVIQKNYLGEFFIKNWVRISSTFSVLRLNFYLRPFIYFGLFTWTSLFQIAYFDLFSNLDFLLVEKYKLKYSFGRSKVQVKVRFRSKLGLGRSKVYVGVKSVSQIQKGPKIGFWSKYRKGRTDADPQKKLSRDFF